jgi:hypothetical protein
LVPEAKALGHWGLEWSLVASQKKMVETASCNTDIITKKLRGRRKDEAKD